jgi:integrase
VRASTWYRYESLIRGHLLPHLGHLGLSTLQPGDCAAAFAVMAKLGLKPRTIIQARAVLGRALREAEIAGLVTRNAARLARPPRVEHAEMLTLTRIEARVLIEAAQTDRLGTLYSVALASGAREGELLALRWCDVDWERGSIKIQRTLQRTAGSLVFAEPKTQSSRRTIPLGASTMKALQRHRLGQAEERLRYGLGKASEDDLVFTTPPGTPIDAGNFLRNTHYPLLERAGLPRVRFHDLRHTAATLLLEAGVHVKVVAERLGHATPSLVMNTYGHATERMQKDATAAMELVLSS